MGDIVVIKDHINFMGNNPLIGKHYDEFGDRFPDMTNIYDNNAINKILKTAKSKKIKVHKGVYFAVGRRCCGNVFSSRSNSRKSNGY